MKNTDLHFEIQLLKFEAHYMNVDSLRPSQQSFSYVGTVLPGLNQY